jgi:hypothetical protein
MEQVRWDRGKAAARVRAVWADHVPPAWAVIVYARNADIANLMNEESPVCRKNVHNVEQL